MKKKPKIDYAPNTRLKEENGLVTYKNFQGSGLNIAFKPLPQFNEGGKEIVKPEEN